MSTPDDFAKRWNEEKYTSVLARAATEAAGEPVSVTFRVASERQKRPQMDSVRTGRTGGSINRATAAANPSAQPLNDRYTFNHFVIGKSNELAAAAAHAVGQHPASNTIRSYLRAHRIGKTT